MRLTAAENEARTLMDEHGLDDWSFAFDNAKVRMGACHYGKRSITLSRTLVNRAEPEVVNNTILHEIAHALSYLRHGREGTGHGYLWKRIAREVGCNAERCHSEDTSVNAPYRIECQGCDAVFTWHRRPKEVNRRCKKCGWKFRTVFSYVDNAFLSETPREGIDFCHCGAKYWDGNTCHSCGGTWEGRSAA